MRQRKDYTNQRFGLLILLKFIKLDKNSVQHYLCRCDCGIEKQISLSSLKAGLIISCGHVRAQTLLLRTKHGFSRRRAKVREYSSWQHMKQRCLNPKNTRYRRYGGRGITICSQWLNNFPQFLRDMGRMPPHCNSIDRIDNNGNYEPENCRWATKEIQHLNQTYRNQYSIC